jgi:CDP-diacylglycerol--glycerol-3-phosphate 3-phosphatidyltransferase
MFGSTVPNLISGARLASAPLLMLAGGMGRPRLFLALFALLLATDLADGLLARLLKQGSRLGARLDTWGDVALYLCAAAGAWLLWPELIRREGRFIAGAIALVGVSAVVSLLKHRHLPAYHTWTAKFSTAMIGLAALLMFAGGSAWPFRLAVAALAVSAAEETGITLVLPAWRPNIRSLRRALQLAREQTSPPPGPEDNRERNGDG